MASKTPKTDSEALGLMLQCVAEGVDELTDKSLEQAIALGLLLGTFYGSAKIKGLQSGITEDMELIVAAAYSSALSSTSESLGKVA